MFLQKTGILFHPAEVVNYIIQVDLELNRFYQFMQEFDAKQEVKMRERDAVAGMFPPPTANQSWRKVLSMGNLLNGHEPTQREIIFSINDGVSNGHYGSEISVTGDEEVETYRMYICGTSNDLWAALSVTSWD